MNNLDTVNRSLGLVLSAIQEVEDRCTSDKAKHLVAHKSNYGWKFVSSLESLEKKVGRGWRFKVVRQGLVGIWFWVLRGEGEELSEKSEQEEQPPVPLLKESHI